MNTNLIDGIKREMKESSPSDEILLNDNAVIELVNFYDKMTGSSEGHSADIIWGNTVPLEDLILTNPAGQKVRICIFRDVMNNLKYLDDEEPVCVGALEEYGTHSYIPIAVQKGIDRIALTGEILLPNGKVSQLRHPKAIFPLLGIWYAVQLALLHPQMRNIFANPIKAKVYEREKVDGKRKRVVRYIKRHIIDPENVAHTMREFHRHCLAWYVVGHWRHYKNGQAIFIKPFWKGQMRKAKHNFDDRERVVAL